MDTPERGEERRKHVRFSMDETSSNLEVLPAAVNAACELQNLSFSGMCFASRRDLEPQQVYSFRIRVRDLQEEPFAAKAEIRWKQSVTGQGFLYGAMFRESSKGWLGPPR